MSKKIRQHVRESCLQGSILGLKYLYAYPDAITRLFWLICLASVYAFAWLITYRLWLRFIELPTRVVLDDPFASIFEIPFPSITVCSPNQLTLSGLSHLKSTLIDGNVSQFDSDAWQLLGYHEFLGDIDEPGLRRLQDIFEINRYDIEEILLTVAQQCDKFLIFCKFGLEVSTCSKLFKPILTEHGSCCVFNNKYSSKNFRLVEDKRFRPFYPAGVSPWSGLTIVTNYMPEDAAPMSIFFGGGTKLLIHDPFEFPAPDELYLIPSNGESFHTINPTVTYCTDDVKMLDPETRQCVYGDEHPLKYFREYRNSDCDSECFLKYVLLKCNCTVPPARQQDKKQCNPVDLPCYSAAKRNQALSTDYSCDCPRECYFREYKCEKSSGNMGAFRHNIFNRLSHLNLTSSHSIIRIYYTNNQFMKYKQDVIMSYIQLISNLGGAFGLCIGFSVVSILEIIFFFSRVLVSWRRSMRARQRWRKLKKIIHEYDITHLNSAETKTYISKY